MLDKLINNFIDKGIYAGSIPVSIYTIWKKETTANSVSVTGLCNLSNDYSVLIVDRFSCNFNSTSSYAVFTCSSFFNSLFLDYNAKNGTVEKNLLVGTRIDEMFNLFDGVVAKDNLVNNILDVCLGGDVQ